MRILETLAGAFLIAGLVSGCGSNADDPSSDDSDAPTGPAGPIGKADCTFCDSIGPEPSGSATTYPIVLAHGMGASTSHFGFFEVANALRADGHVVYEGSVPPFQSAEVRAKALATFVDQALSETGAAKVNLIAHSMGGLDSRALAWTLGYADRIASITTISTPHRGSHAADALLAMMDGAGGDSALIEAFAKAYGASFSDAAEDSNLRATLTDISEANADLWNAFHLDDGRVYYQSVAGVSSIGGIVNPHDIEACDYRYFNRRSGKAAYPGSALGADVMSPLVAPFTATVAHGTSFDPNDGLVTVESAKWGTFLGCIPADHADEVGQVSHKKGDLVTGFDHKRFYRNLVFDLSRKGF